MAERRKLDEIKLGKNFNELVREKNFLLVLNCLIIKIPKYFIYTMISNNLTKRE